jgi:hypothetical protein
MADKIAHQLFPQQCGCADCEAAVSPAAYLAALFDYALQHVRNNKLKFDLKFLENTFHQPFSELPTDCEAVEKQVRQVRICVEVLRRYLGKRPLANPDKEAALVKAEEDYRFAAYAFLLSRIGTTYEEIRRIHKELPETRQALAERLGIDLTQPRPANPPGDELDQLFLDAKAQPPAPHALTEQVLETLFGLADTTRDPLSEAAKLGDDQNQITRWNLNGAIWGQNTDPGGMVYITLASPAANTFRIELYQDSDRTKLVAAGEILETSGTVKLIEQNNSRLTGVVEIAYTVGSTTIAIAAIPTFLAWQLKHLRTLWIQQDHPADGYSDDASPKLPLIDPDLIGPDDFRKPIPVENPAFDLWLKRRQAVDQQLRDFKANREANGLTSILQAEFGNPLPDFDGALLTLTKGGTTDEIKAAKGSVIALGLTLESFTRLMAIRAKDQLASDPRNEKVSEAEWSEVYSILTQVTKVRQFDTWRTEEQTINLLFGTQAFWLALSEPKEGDWPPLLTPNYPLIDPAITKLADLPDVTVGKAAIALWNDRKSQLEQIPQLLKTEREANGANGFDAMLRWALGDPNPGNALQYDLETLKTNLASPVPATRDATIQQIETDLHLTVDTFKRLMTIKANNNPTAAEWAEVYTILTPARKVKHEYPGWVAAEQAANLVDWQALKAKLPRWRAPLEARIAWQQALRVRSQRPIIDPTVMGADDLQHVIPGNPAFDVWKARYDGLTTLRDGLKTTCEADASALNGLDTIIKTTLAVEPSDLEAIDQDRQAGYSIEKRLEQLNLTYGSFNYLMRIRGLAKAGEPIIESEWEIVYATLAQSQIQRQYAALRIEEANKSIVLSPDFFKIPKALLTPLPFLAPSVPIWLSTSEARRDWQDTLQSRIDQENSTIEALRNVISTVEEAALPPLRNALIQASDAIGTNLDERAEWITGRLLIDAKAGGCQVTTRVEQAIETIQTLIFSLRTGQFKQLATIPLSLIADNFDEEWKWIGSYATWRAAMFVFLYPENILQPSLLPYKTQVFEELITNTRAKRLDPANACKEAETYAKYFRDICSLEIEATCQAFTVMYTGEGCDRQQTDTRSMFYMFGRAPSGKIYWSAYDAGNKSSEYNQTVWKEVRKFSDLEVVRIIGAMPYRKEGGLKGSPVGYVVKVPVGNVVKEVGSKTFSYRYTSGLSYIHLFCLTRDGDKQTLKLARLNLDHFGEWDETLHELTIPPVNISSVEIVPVQTQSEIRRPGLIFHTQNYFKLYYRQLNVDGVEWEQNNVDWSQYFFQFKFTGPIIYLDPPDSIRAVLSFNNDNRNSLWFLTSNPNDGSLTLELQELKPGGKPPSVAVALLFSKSEFLGILPGPEDETPGSKFRPSSVYIFWRDSSGSHYRQFNNSAANGGNNPQHDALADLIQIPSHSGSSPATQHMLAYKKEKYLQAYYMYRYSESGDKLIGAATIRAVPRVEAPLNIPLHLSVTDLQKRRQEMIDAFALNADATSSVLAYLREAYYFVPLHLALALQTAGQYLASLDCFRTIYDYEAQLGAPTNPRNIYYGLELDAKLPDMPLYQQSEGWLLDPLNPHLIAATRHYAYTRFTIMSLVRCLRDFADSEFTQDTGESLARARTLYLTALDLLNLPELQQKLGKCDDLIARLKIEPGKDIPPEVPAAVGEIMDDLTRAKGLSIPLTNVVETVERKLAEREVRDFKLAEARAVVQEAIDQAPIPSSTGTVVIQRTDNLNEKHALLFTQPGIDSGMRFVGKAALIYANHFLPAGNPPPNNQPKPPQPPAQPVIAPSLQFCIPPNPILKALHLHAKLNLSKLRSCRNIAGIKRELDPYAAPTDTTTGLPTIGAGGQLLLPGVARIQPTLYRYSVLIERAKQLVQLAGQIEATFLTTLEKRDNEAYTLLKARQDLSLAQAGIKLQNLRLSEANVGVTLAQLQQTRAQIQTDHYESLINADISEQEKKYLTLLKEVTSLYNKAADKNFDALFDASESVTISVGGGVDGPSGSTSYGKSYISTSAGYASIYASQASAKSTDASRIAALASYERRRQNWELQEALAQQDLLIGAQQITIASDRVEIVTQEKVIAELQTSNAKDTIEFLTTKFTNANLYEWMSGILEGVYRFFLQQATSIAKLAENQLAFERQEVPPAYIQADYWNAPSDGATSSNLNTPAPDRKGLTGSARLLQDIYQLDQYAFNTNKRKLQLSKTISLALLAPEAFQRFRETGVMIFATPMEMFDRDFPGHYLRLIHRVRTSVIALIPPTQGIHATLTSSGLSRTVIGPDIFQTVSIRRDPEFVALTAPINSTGMFELEPQQTDMLFPFEGNGVDSTWEFRMPKAANQLDYRAIADILITIEHTALNSFDYREQVIQTLKPNLSADRPFSFRNQFADQWYDLNNPDQTKTPMKVKFQTFRADFPPNVETLKIQQVLLYFVRASQKTFELPITTLRFTEQGNQGTVGGSATPIDGKISTRSGNAGSWTAMIGKTPVGDWELTLPNTEEVKKHFLDEEIDDILFVITYSGRTPEWPI